MKKSDVKKELTVEQKKRYYTGLVVYATLIMASAILLVLSCGVFFVGAYYNLNLGLVLGSGLFIFIYIIAEYTLWSSKKKYLKEE